jgi:hypothetical protein
VLGDALPIHPYADALLGKVAAVARTLAAEVHATGHLTWDRDVTAWFRASVAWCSVTRAPTTTPSPTSSPSCQHGGSGQAARGSSWAVKCRNHFGCDTIRSPRSWSARAATSAITSPT